VGTYRVHFPGLAGRCPDRDLRPHSV